MTLPTTTDGDSMIKEDIAVLVIVEPTTDDLVEDSIPDRPLEESPTSEVPAGDLTTNVFRLSSLFCFC